MTVLQRRIRSHVTYANVLATLSIFIVLGGVAWAAAPRNSVNSSSIRNNSIRTVDVRNNNLRSADIRNNTLTGTDIRESSLAIVPSASSATSLTNYYSFGRRTATPSTAATAAQGMTGATQVKLLSVGAIRIYGKCYTDTSTDTVYSQIFAQSTVDGSVMSSDSDDLFGGATAAEFLSPGTGEDLRKIANASVGANSATLRGGNDEPYVIHGADGTSVIGLVSVGAKNGTLAGGTGVWGTGDMCIFSGTAQVTPA